MVRVRWSGVLTGLGAAACPDRRASGCRLRGGCRIGSSSGLSTWLAPAWRLVHARTRRRRTGSLQPSAKPPAVEPKRPLTSPRSYARRSRTLSPPGSIQEMRGLFKRKTQQLDATRPVKQRRARGFEARNSGCELPERPRRSVARPREKGDKCSSRGLLRQRS
jgi:hypothetical protein